MNFVNCTGSLSPELMRKTVIFWCGNSAQHITSLLRSPMGTTAVLEDFFKEKLKDYYERFTLAKENFEQRNLPIARYQDFLRINSGFINLLERIKYEGFSGYPILQQSVFHYIYEARYINAVFGTKNMNGNVLITTYFLPFLNNNIGCVYNQMYFWSIIGSMHPSLLMGNNAFYNAINGYSKEFLTEVCNRFNGINFALSSLKKPLKKSGVGMIFADFCRLNNEYLEFLKEIKQTSPKIFTLPATMRLPSTFYSAVDHQIAEHTLVSEICGNIEKLL